METSHLSNTDIRMLREEVVSLRRELAGIRLTMSLNAATLDLGLLAIPVVMVFLVAMKLT